MKKTIRCVAWMAMSAALMTNIPATADEYVEAISEAEEVFVDDAIVDEEAYEIETVDDSFIEDEAFEDEIDDTLFEDEETQEEGYVFADSGDVVASGTAGANITWEITGTEGDYLLTFSGFGEMRGGNWDSYKSGIKEVIIQDGITSVNS